MDLTHIFDTNATKYPLSSFNIQNFTYYKHWSISEQYHGLDNNTANRMWLAFKYMEFYEHMGTHIDAPYHFAENGQKLHEIPPERLMGPGVVIDVREKARANPNYGVTVEDLLEYEDKYGRIPPRAIVMMNSGWSMKYPNPNLVFGTETPDIVNTFNFPGWHYDACEFLLKERQVGVLGVDTPSTDPAKVTKDPYGYNYPCHMYLQPEEVPLLEYVAKLDSVPANGTTMFLGAIKSRDGTGGPTRIFAVIEDGSCTITGGASTNMVNVVSIFGYSLITLAFLRNI